MLALLAAGVGSIALPLIVTAGGPGAATTTPALAMVQQAFSLFRPGTGSAISTVMLALSMLFAIVYLRKVGRSALDGEA